MTDTVTKEQMQAILDDALGSVQGGYGDIDMGLDPSTVRYITERAMMFEELVEGLRPFAAVAAADIGADEHDSDLYRPMEHHNHAPRLTVGFLRAANTLLTRAQSLNGGKNG